jgi:hypothetical protein
MATNMFACICTRHKPMSSMLLDRAHMLFYIKGSSDSNIENRKGLAYLHTANVRK